ncbi:MAG: AEC family transporter [Candidatus Eisenbacteria bacterium]|uniref:AEC family transporter n=1 Tax=Eiseniibacteriota bacterium TaxID=2212470 RepID=A0A956RPE7_UNCEI|nr:AEC family transporter [Candidatus Eisenbacteria bacterium]
MTENVRIVLGSVIEVFGVVLVSYFYARRFRPDFTDVIRFVTADLVPCLVFTAILGSTVDAGEIRDATGATLIQIGTGLLLGWIVLRMLGWQDRRELLLPATFVNSANLPFPLLIANFGPEALSRGVICFMVTSTAVFSVGIAILYGKTQLRTALREPVLWATALALLCKAIDFQPPDIVLRVPHLAGQAAVPMMLVLLGESLSRIGLSSLREAVVVLIVRYGSGLLALWATLAWIRPEGELRRVLIVYALLPAAVINLVLARRVGRPSDGVASAVLLTTLASAILLPFLLAHLR